MAGKALKIRTKTTFISPQSNAEIWSDIDAALEEIQFTSELDMLENYEEKQRIIQNFIKIIELSQKKLIKKLC